MRVWELRNELEADLRDLKSAPAARQTILSTAHKYFEPFSWDDAQEMITVCELRDPPPAREEGETGKKSFSITENLRQKRQRKADRKEAKRNDRVGDMPSDDELGGGTDSLFGGEEDSSA